MSWSYIIIYTSIAAIIIECMISPDASNGGVVEEVAVTEEDL